MTVADIKDYIDYQANEMIELNRENYSLDPLSVKTILDEIKSMLDQLDNDLVDKEVVRITNNGVDVNDREKEWQEKRVHIELKGLTEDEYNLLDYYRASGLKIRIIGEPYKREE